MDDAKLPALRLATNNDVMRNKFSDVLSREQALSFDKVQYQVLKHKAGKHCVVQYWLEPKSQSSEAKTPLIGKMYRLNRGQARFDNLQRLWRAAITRAGNDAPLGMPEPLAYIHELGMILQSTVQGHLLSDLPDSEDLSAAMEHVGENLAKLHGLPIRFPEIKTMDDHIRKFCRPGPQALIATCPSLSAIVETLLNAFYTDERLIGAPICPVHGDLNLKQIFIRDEKAAFIDFDGLCLAHPALDLGNFIVVIETHYPAKCALLKEKFLSGYLKYRTPVMLSGLPVYRAFSYFRRAMIIFRKNPSADCLSQIRPLLERSVASLEGRK